MTRGHRGSLLLRCRALPSASPCRFIPALCTSRPTQRIPSGMSAPPRRCGPRRSWNLRREHQPATRGCRLPSTPSQPVLHSVPVERRVSARVDPVGSMRRCGGASGLGQRGCGPPRVLPREVSVLGFSPLREDSRLGCGGARPRAFRTESSRVRWVSPDHPPSSAHGLLLRSR